VCSSLSDNTKPQVCIYRGNLYQFFASKFSKLIKIYKTTNTAQKYKSTSIVSDNWRLKWGSVNHQMAVPVPSVSCCVLNNNDSFYQEPNELAFNRDTCCHLVFCLQLIASHYSNERFIMLAKDVPIFIRIHILVCKIFRRILSRYVISPTWHFTQPRFIYNGSFTRESNFELG
jgi:hypothetical protein